MTSTTNSTDHYGQTFSYCGSNTPGFCVHRRNPATSGGAQQNYYMCQTQYGEEIFGYAPNWQKYIDITPIGEKVVKNFTMSYSPSDTVTLDQTQGGSILTTYLSTAPGGFGGGGGDKLWNMIYQSPFPIAMSGTCKPSTPSPTCAATTTCTYSSTTRVNSTTEYSTYSCDNGGTYRTPNHWYVGPTPYPSARWYLAGVQITVPKNGTTGGDTSCSGGSPTITPSEAESVCENRTDGTGVSCEWEYNMYGPQQDGSGNWWCTEVFTGDNCGNTYCYATEAPITKSGGVVSVGSYSSNDRWCN
ncbi:hypothetical protein LBX01_08460 [Altererythrobacter sp. N1]|nr:hypothetical protein LBX01_08460 [Altererythrobacter sp. N1]